MIAILCIKVLNENTIMKCFVKPLFLLKKSKQKGIIEAQLYDALLFRIETVQAIDCAIWQYGLWSFQMGGKKLERFLPKNQHTQRKLLNFENWVNGEVSKIEHHFRK